MHIILRLARSRVAPITNDPEGLKHATLNMRHQQLAPSPVVVVNPGYTARAASGADSMHELYISRIQATCLSRTHTDQISTARS